MGNRYTPDGTPVFTPSMFPEVAAYVITGAADSVTLGRGKGAPFNFFSDPPVGALGAIQPQTSQLKFSFLDPIWLAGGTIFYDGGVPGDTLEFLVQAPASTVILSPDQSGNCKLAPLSGGISMIVPAQGDGTHNLDKPVPVPAWDSTPDMNPNGYWECCDPTMATQITTPSPDNTRLPIVGAGKVLASAVAGHGSYSLYTVTVPLERFMVAVPIVGSRTLRFAPQIKPKTCLNCYEFVASLYNSGHMGLRVGWMLEIGRVQTL